MIGEACGVERLDDFHALLTEWNARMDLTAVTEPREALTRHYLDSLTALPYLPQSARVVDVGTGAGFPGMPLALARPDLRFTLLDAREKRVQFLRAAIEALGVSATAVHARAEDFAKAHREAFDVAVSRAVAKLPVLLEWMLPMVAVGGFALVWKGPEVASELDGAARAAALLGGGTISLLETSIPGTDFRHVLVRVEKSAPTDAKYPRRAGVAEKRPLG